MRLDHPRYDRCFCGPFITLLANDIDVDATDVLGVTVSATTSQRGASIHDNGNGSFTYDPSAVHEFQQLDLGEVLDDTVRVRFGGVADHLSRCIEAPLTTDKR